ncbi:endo-1,3-alpha-glucanase family glycosylhydrolase [Microbacterium radiodurans]|nr:endo-1,3-alpha-glucanase family glycosylhydrolase [Microbacterium radiodurans]
MTSALGAQAAESAPADTSPQPSGEPAAQTLTLAAADTAVVSARQPRAVLSRHPLSATASQDRSYLLFDLPDDVDPTQPVRATLDLTVGFSSARAAGLEVFAESGTWSGQSLTYAGRPAETGSRLNAVAPVARSGSDLSIDLGDVAAVAADGDLSLRMSYRQRYISSTYVRTGDGAPQLRVTYTPKAAPQPEPETPAPPVQPEPDPETPAPPVVPAIPGKEIFAHYFPPYPVSIDNRPADSDYYARNYLQPDGEGGRHAGYGGLLRDRPEPVPVSSSSDWRTQNLQREVQQASAAGIDGFTVNIMGLAGSNWEATKNLFIAAEREGDFAVVPMIDATASAGDADPGTVADRLAELYTSSAAYRVGGRALLSSFAAERQSVDWWRQIIDRLQNVHGVPVTFQAVFLNASDANMAAFRGIADGYGNWGVRTEWNTLNGPDYAARAASYGKSWIAPVSVQDYRPRSGVFAEAGNTANLRASWQRAIDSGAQYVQLVTWNDYSESTQFAPSVDHGDAFLDASRPFVDWFHTGVEPAITEDQAFLTHRTQFAGALPELLHRLATPTLGGTSIAPTDNVEALVYLTAPATLTFTVGGRTTGVDAPAGRSAVTVPLRSGSVSLTVSRDGSAVIELDSPYAVVDRPVVEDLGYYAVDSVE